MDTPLFIGRPPSRQALNNRQIGQSSAPPGDCPTSPWTCRETVQSDKRCSSSLCNYTESERATTHARRPMMFAISHSTSQSQSVSRRVRHASDEWIPARRSVIATRSVDSFAAVTFYNWNYIGFEACPLNKSQIHSLEFAHNSCLRKILLWQW